MSVRLLYSKLSPSMSLMTKLVIRSARRNVSCTSKFQYAPPNDEENHKNSVKNSQFDVDDTLLQSSDIKDEQLNDLRETSNSGEPNFNIDEMILSNSSATGNDFEIPGDEDDEYMSDDDISAQILSVALEFVPTHGWSNRAIEEAVKTLDLSPSSAGMFKRGGVDLVLHFIEECNNALSDHMVENSKRVNNKHISTSVFIEEAVQTRLKMIIPYMDSWPQALTLLASPMAVTDCLEHGANMIDEIWYHAGDMSTDMDWYTKRAALAAVYASTELYMLRDNSVEFNDTWDFLHRRLEEFKAGEITKNSFAHAMNDFYALASAGFTTAQNIFGINSRNR